MFFAPLYNMQLVDSYLMVFYDQGGGDIVIITTPGGDYITGDGSDLKAVGSANIELEAATAVIIDSAKVDFEDDSVILAFGADEATKLR